MLCPNLKGQFVPKSDLVSMTYHNTAIEYQGSSGGSHQGRHPADDMWIAQSTGRLHEMGHLAHDLMHRCILRGDPLQREAKFRTLVKITRALPARLLINEV